MERVRALARARICAEQVLAPSCACFDAKRLAIGKLPDVHMAYYAGAEAKEIEKRIERPQMFANIWAERGYINLRFCDAFLLRLMQEEVAGIEDTICLERMTQAQLFGEVEYAIARLRMAARKRVFAPLSKDQSRALWELIGLAAYVHPDKQEQRVRTCARMFAALTSGERAKLPSGLANLGAKGLASWVYALAKGWKEEELRICDKKR